MEQQSATTQAIERSVREAAEDTREISGTISAVQQDATRTGAAPSEVLGAARQLSRQAQAVAGEVNRFVAALQAA